MDLYFTRKNISILGESIEVSVDTVDLLKLWMIKVSEMNAFVTINNYDILI